MTNPVHTITLHTLWVKHPESYAGQLLPELVLAWGEDSVENNPDGWDTAVKEALEVYTDAIDHQFLNIEVPEAAVLGAFKTPVVAAASVEQVS